MSFPSICVAIWITDLLQLYARLAMDIEVWMLWLSNWVDWMYTNTTALCKYIWVKHNVNTRKVYMHLYKISCVADCLIISSCVYKYGQNCNYFGLLVSGASVRQALEGGLIGLIRGDSPPLVQIRQKSHGVRGCITANTIGSNKGWDFIISNIIK